MPNIVPGVSWQPINIGSRAARRKGRGLCGHVAVSNSKNLVPGPNADWHFYLPKDGPAIQYIDLDLQCWASGDGNSTMAAFESEGGMGSTAQVNAEPWTENQLNWAARILRHMHDTEGVPLQVMASSASSERGFGTHRLGVPGYMQPGTEQWSSSAGKLCPGDAKHAQRFEVVRRAGGLATTSEGFLMALNDAQQIEVYQLLKEVRGALYGGMTSGQNNFNYLDNRTRPFIAYRNTDNGNIFLGAPGQWIPVPSTDAYKQFIAVGLCPPGDYLVNLASADFKAVAVAYTGG